MPQSNKPLALPHGTPQTAGLMEGDIKGAVLSYDTTGLRTLSILTTHGWIDIPATDDNIRYLSNLDITPHVPEPVSVEAASLPGLASLPSLGGKDDIA